MARCTKRHTVALARLMNLPMAEVYEVASFYHHFEILRDGEQPARPVLRVCDSLSCQMAGAGELLAQLPGRLRALGHGDVRVQAVPCVGRCEQAPVAVVHQCPVPHATAERVLAQVDSMPERALALHPQAPAATVLMWRPNPPSPAAARAWRPPGWGWPPTARRAATGWPPMSPRAACRAMPCSPPWRTRACAAWGRRLSCRAQVAHRARAGCPAAHGREHRRGRARHFQGPHLPGARPAPLPRRPARRRAGGGHRCLLRLPARRIPRLPRHPAAGPGRAAGRPALRAARHRAAAARARTSAARSPR